MSSGVFKIYESRDESLTLPPSRILQDPSVCTCVLPSIQTTRCSSGFKSREWDVHRKIVTLWFVYLLLVDFEVCLRPLIEPITARFQLPGSKNIDTALLRSSVSRVWIINGGHSVFLTFVTGHFSPHNDDHKIDGHVMVKGPKLGNQILLQDSRLK